MKTAKELILEAEGLLTKAKGILADTKSTAEDKEKVPQMLEEARALKSQAGLLNDIDVEGAQIKAAMESEQQPVTPSPSVGEFKSWGDFLQTVWLFKAAHRVDQRLVYLDERGEVDAYGRGQQAKNMNEAIGAQGGFLVPTEHMTTLYAIAAEQSLVRGRATVIRMGRRHATLPVLDQTGATAGQPHWFGGMYAEWTEEAQTKPKTEPKWRQIDLVAHKLTMYTVASDELNADSAISLSDFVSGPMGFGGAISWAEDYTFFQGSGAGQPLGVLNAGATISIPRASANHITYPDLVNMFGEFLQSANGAWFASISCIPELLQMNGPAGNPAYLWGSAKDGVPTTLLGLPIYFTEKLPALGTSGDLLLADWRYYLIGDRQATTVDSNKLGTTWRTDETEWRAVHRVDGQPWLSAPLTYQDGVHQCSPFVILGAKTT